MPIIPNKITFTKDTYIYKLSYHMDVDAVMETWESPHRGVFITTSFPS